MNFVTAYSPKEKVSFCTVGHSMTKQSDREACDINNILKRFKKQQGIDLMKEYAGYFGGKFADVSAGLDLRTALSQLSEAEAAFGALPAEVRARFGNRADKMLDFLGDSANRDEAIKLGLLKKPVDKPASDSAPTGKEG